MRILSAPISVNLVLTEACNLNCRHCYNFWRPENKKSVTLAKEKIDKLNIIYSSLFLQLIHVCAVAGISAKEIVPYSSEDFKKIFADDLEDYDTLRLTKGYLETVEANGMTDATELLLMILAEESLREKAEYKWIGVFFLTLAIYVVYEKFKILSDELKEVILGTYFYRAIFLGVPVQKILKDVFDDRATVIIHDRLSVLYKNVIDSSLEWVAIKPVGEKIEEGLSLIIRKYNKFLSERGSVAKKDEFLDNIFLFAVFSLHLLFVLEAVSL